jgi:flagellar P-ring protein precursor FlgI
MRPASLLLRATLAVLACFTPALAQFQPSIAPPHPGEVAAPPAPGSLPRSRRENPAVSIQDLVKIAGQNASPIRGMGIVTGLPKTGDSGAELALARPLMQIYANNGMPLGEIRELSKAKGTSAIVSLWAEIPESGGRAGDRFDVIVSAMHSASSLKGGMLMISPMLGPLPSKPGDDPKANLWAFASGPIIIEATDSPTVGRIRDGCQLIKDLPRRIPNQVVDLIVRPHFRSYSTTRMIASEINGLTADLENTDDSAGMIAQAVDDTLIRVSIPEHERGNPSNFIASVLTKRFSPSLLDLPAQVVVNERTGTIIVTGDVEISSVTIGNDALVITTTTPPINPTAADPLVTRTNWAEFGSTSTNAERARIQDLLEAFKQLNVPARQQIQILAQINQTGRLHARFIRD